MNEHEKAVFPTDDEREALYLIEQAASFRQQTRPDVDAFPNSMVGLWLRTASALKAALRRVEVAEPSAGCCDGPGGAERCGDCPLDHPEQGEPSDVQVLAALNANQAADFRLCGYSHVPVESTNLGDWHPLNVEIMRAALRAAGGVR